MLDEFLSWWIARLRELIPTRLRRPGLDSMPALIVSADWNAPLAPAPVGLRENGVERALGAIDLDETARGGTASLLGGRPRPSLTILRLGPGALLDREVALPLAAERDLDNVLAFEMDRLTPFAADEIVHSHEVLSRDRAAGRLSLRLVLARRDVVEPIVARLARAGLAPQAIEAPGSAGVARRLLLGRARAARSGSIGTGAAWAACAVLALLVLAAPFVRQHEALARSARAIALLGPPVAQANALRARIVASTAGADVLADASRDIADPIRTLALVTRLLPDDTFLTDFTLAGRKLTMNGQSASAARLIGALAADPTIRNPSFVAPVTRLEATHTDLFSIRADVAP